VRDLPPDPGEVADRDPDVPPTPTLVRPSSMLEALRCLGYRRFYGAFWAKPVGCSLLVFSERTGVVTNYVMGEDGSLRAWDNRELGTWEDPNDFRKSLQVYEASTRFDMPTNGPPASLGFFTIGDMA